MTALLTTEDTLILDEMLRHEAGCEVKHQATICSVTVTHRITSTCHDNTLACTNSARRSLHLIDKGDVICLCGLNAAVCWQVLPA